MTPLVIDSAIDPKTIDPCYQKITIEFDTEAIRSDLSGGIEVPFAKFGEVGTHLRLK